jgi:uncharacterized protein (DUF3084 family)
MTVIQYGIGIILIATVIVTGCVTTDNPKEGDIFGSVYNLSTGTYDEREKKFEADKNATIQELHETAKEQQHLENEKIQTQRDIINLERQIAGISEETQHLSAQVAKIRSKNTASRIKKAQLSKTVKGLHTKIVRLKKQARTQSKTSAASLANYKKQAKQLEKEVADLWEVYHTLQ